jgi:raffinose/stachyose/melibiose transport system substrate-binding protein
MRLRKVVAGSAAVLLGALALSGCSTGSGDSGDGNVTLTFWHNSTTGPGKKY